MTRAKLNYHLKQPARTNQFRVNSLFPASLGISTSKLELAEVMVKSVNTPPSTLGEITLFYDGKPSKFSGDRQYGDVSITFRVDRDYRIYNIFKEWSNYIVGTQTDTASADKNLYIAYINITAVTLTQTVPVPSQTWTIFDAWPREISELAFDRDSADQSLEFTVTFSNSDWLSTNPNLQAL